jgi:hypothetical protein
MPTMLSVIRPLQVERVGMADITGIMVEGGHSVVTRGHKRQPAVLTPQLQAVELPLLPAVFRRRRLERRRPMPHDVPAAAAGEARSAGEGEQCLLVRKEDKQVLGVGRPTQAVLR